jgi:hypothetical protein
MTLSYTVIASPRKRRALFSPNVLQEDAQRAIIHYLIEASTIMPTSKKEGSLSIVPEHKKSKKQGKASHGVSKEEELDSEDERRLKKEQRRAKRLAKHLAELGLDENGDPIDNFSLLKYPVREWKFKLPGFDESIAINPVVTFIAVVCLWAIVLWSSSKFVRRAKRAKSSTIMLN